ncbi:unnamed protein product [Mytilus coruscus]|uniref:DDE Tnp4 domain-containing protein n=1 Tax=Mytilus coruscus TaxID=42192 RepID=A0A6J8CIE0_MYTCO|nr:unnamed protein product [Mytilus coruscus]
MPRIRSYCCVICLKTNVKENNRRPVINTQLQNYIKSLIKRNVYEHDIKCSKCRSRIRRKLQSQTLVDVATDDDENCAQGLPGPAEVISPKTIQLSISSTSKSHRRCIICKKENTIRHRLVVVPKEAATQALIDKGIFISTNSRCCPDHLIGKYFKQNALKTVQQSSSSSYFNHTDISELLERTRAVIKDTGKLNFDISSSLSDDVSVNLTGLTREQFDAVALHVKDLRNSEHTTPTAKTLFANDNDDTFIFVIDGIYLYIQKSSIHQFQKMTYSMHKGRPSVKPMLIVGADGYILNVMGPYFADYHNNDASITKHLFETNAEDIKNWVQENDVLVVDRGFRDAQKFLENMNLKVEMLFYIKKGMKQHPTEEANASRLITKKPRQAEVEVGDDIQDLEPVTVAVVEYNKFTVYLGTIREKTMTFAKAKLGKLKHQLCKKKMLDSSLQLDKNDVLEIVDNYLISKFKGHVKNGKKYYYPRSRNCQLLIPLQII